MYVYRWIYEKKLEHIYNAYDIYICLWLNGGVDGLGRGYDCIEVSH